MSNIVNFFFQFINNVKLYHWQTHSYARHKAADELFEKIISLSDEFMESFIGRYGRPKMEKKDLDIVIKEFSDEEITKYLKSCVAFLTKDITRQLSTSDVELLNIRDELVGHVTKALYLFTLK